MQQINSILIGWIETSCLCPSFKKVSWLWPWLYLFQSCLLTHTYYTFIYLLYSYTILRENKKTQYSPTQTYSLRTLIDWSYITKVDTCNKETIFDQIYQGKYSESGGNRQSHPNTRLIWQNNQFLCSYQLI